MASVRSVTSTAEASNFAGASAWVNEPYVSDAHALWAEIEAASPPPKPRRRTDSTPRQRQLGSRSLSPDRIDSVKATGDQSTPTSSQAGEGGTPKKPVGRPSPYGQEQLKKEKPKRKASPKGNRGKKDSPKDSNGHGSTSKANTSRPRSASPGKRRPQTDRTDGTGRLVQPAWNTSRPPRRAPGEVINKYNHLGLMEETAEELHEFSAGGNTAAGGFSSMSGFSSCTTGEAGSAARLSRVTTSPSTRCHPNQERRNELRSADVSADAQEAPPLGKARSGGGQPLHFDV